MLAPLLLIYDEKKKKKKKTQLHFFHCLTQYGEVAPLVCRKSARDDIHFVLLIQTLGVFSSLLFLVDLFNCAVSPSSSKTSYSKFAVAPHSPDMSFCK